LDLGPISAPSRSSGEKAVPAVLRATRILDLVAQAENPMNVSELARRLDLPKSTVHGLCVTLTNLGLLSRRPANAFGVGPHVMRWANAFLSQTEITQEFMRLWDEMNVLPRETITLSLLDGKDVVYIACRNGDAPLGVTFRIGMRLPAAFTATGKAMLSAMPDEQVRQIMAGAWSEPLTCRSVRGIEALLRELEETRQRGFSIDDGQVREGMYCFGAPVRDSTGHAAAGVAVSILMTGVNDGTIAAAGKAVRTVADQLSRRLGAEFPVTPKN
jgi:DNA-binding IclR family transcriptional regulator